MINRKGYFNKYRIDNKEKIFECNKEYRRKNKEKCLEANKKWWNVNPEYMKQWKKLNIGYDNKYYKEHKRHIKEYHKKYYKDNREEIMKYRNQYEKDKRKIDLKYNLNNKMRILIWKSLKGNKKGKHWETFVYYTLNNLIKHLKITMPKEYNWQDYLENKLQIDHIIPIRIFNFTKPEHIDFQRCWDLSNLRLLPSKDNNCKSGKLNKPFQPSLKII